MANVILMGDFETTTEHQYNEEGQTRVWASCLVHVETGKVVHLENNIESTLDYLRQLTKYTNVTIYYHNLKFDGEFWLSHLLNNGFVYNDKLDCKDSISTLITDTGAFYQLTIKFNKGKNANRVTIYDSLKVLPLPVKALAKAFNLPIAKGEIDYHGKRKVNHTITAEEKEYIETDCKIVAGCLKALHEQGLTKMTLASNALDHYKFLIGKQEFSGRYPLLNDLHNNGKESIPSPTGKESGIKTIDDYIRKAYRGGWTYTSKLYKNKTLKQEGQTYDVNSLYPSVMEQQLLPYQAPIYFKGEYKENPNYPLYIQRIKCKFKIKKGFVPIIQLKGNCRFLDSEYVYNSGAERVTLTLTNIDLELIKQHYTLTRVEYIDGYMFKGAHGLFDEYIGYWKNQKIYAEQQGNSGLRQIAKLMLNSLYGKFAQSPSGTLKQPTLEEGVTKMEIIEGDDRETVYTAMACFITAYAREVTINAVTSVGGENKGSRFCYADTDSIHILGTDTPAIDIHSTRFGAWKHECNWQQAKFIRAKTYYELINGHLDVKCAGMPDNIKKKVTIDNFKVGFSSNGKLIPKRVKGGVILIDTEFTIK